MRQEELWEGQEGHKSGVVVEVGGRKGKGDEREEQEMKQER